MTLFTKKGHWLLLGLFMLITFFANLGALPTDIMESRNIVTGREMVSDGNWLVPTMNGELRLEKPPLPTWIAGAVECVAPGSLTAQRVPAALMGCLWTVCLLLLARYIARRDDYAMAATMVFLTCYNLILMGRSATWDIYCHAFMMAAIYHLTRALFEDRHSLRRFALAGTLMGLSFLSKGPVAFYALLLPYLVALTALRRPRMAGKWGGVALLVLVMTAIGAWWYVYLLKLHPIEASQVFHKETGSWADHNTRPWYYYWRFFLETGVWTVLVLGALAMGYWRRHITLRREYVFALTWTLACLVLLSLMPEKKTRYLLPLLAPCALLVATVIVHFSQARTKLDGFGKWLWRVNGWTTATVVAAIPVLGFYLGIRKGVIGWTAEVMTTLVVLPALVVIVRATLRCRPLSYVTAVATVFAGIELFMLPAVGNAFGNPQARSIRRLADKTELRGIPFYHSDKQPLRIELVYEAGRKILPLNLNDERLVMSRLPMVIVTRGYAREELPATLLDKVDTVSYGHFDDNKHPKTDKHYNKAFLNYVTLLKNKK